MTDCLDAALKYASRGWPVFPLWGKDGKRPLTEHGFKDATTDQDTIKSWWERWPHANVGIACGQQSFDVVDIDGNDGEKCLLDWLEDRGLFDEGKSIINSTLISITAKGKHLCFKPSKQLRNAIKAVPDIDVKTDGGYIVAPPSFHRGRGITYTWAPGHGPDDITLAAMPEWLIEYLKSGKTSKKGLFSDDVIKINAGERNQVLFKQGASARARGQGRPAIAAALLALNESQCAPPLPEDEVMRIVESVMQYDAGGSKDAIQPPTDESEFTLSDFGEQTSIKVKKLDPETGTQRLVDSKKFVFLRHKAADSIKKKMNVVMTPSSKNIYHFDGEIFSPSGEAIIKSTIYSVCKSSVTRGEVNEVLDRVRADLSINPTDLIPEPHLMPLKNGVFDLETGKLMDYSPDHKFTFKYNASWDPTGGNWKRVLWHLCSSLGGPNAVLQAIDVMVATAVRIPFGAWILLIGSGNNGKGMFERLLLNFVTMDRASAPTIDELKKSHFATGHLLNTDLMIVSEVENVKDVNSVLKKLATGEFMDSDVKYGGRAKGSPHLMMIMDANNAFEYGDDSFGRKRRTLKLDWPYVFGDGPNDRPIDRRIDEVFKSDEVMSGVAWIIAARAPTLLQTRKIHSYKSIEQMDNEFDRQRNSLYYFTEECLGTKREQFVAERITTTEAHELYVEWCTHFNVPTPASQKQLTSYIKKKFGVDTQKSSTTSSGEKSDYRYFESVVLVKTPSEAHADHLLAYNCTADDSIYTADLVNNTALISPFTAHDSERGGKEIAVTAITAVMARNFNEIILEIESMFSYIKSCENSPEMISIKNYLENSAVSAVIAVNDSRRAQNPTADEKTSAVKPADRRNEGGSEYQSVSENIAEDKRRLAEKAERFKTP